MKTQNIETWLPLFPGYYHSLIDGESFEESEIDHWREETKNENLGYDDLKWDYTTYQNDVNENSCDFVEEQLKVLNLIKSIKFQEMVSPKYYNFSTDHINIEIVLSEKNKLFILDYLKNNKDSFSTYLKENYKSYDGFSSSYSYQFEDWCNKENIEDTHQLGAILNFILFNEDADIMESYYNTVLEDTYLSAELIEN